MPELATPPPAAPPAAAPAADTKPADPLFNPALEEHFKSYDKPAGAAPTAKPAEKPKADKPAAPKDKSAEPKAKEADVKPAKEDAKPAEPAVEEHKNIKELRTAYETTKKAAQAHEAKIKELESRIAESTKNQPVADEKVWQEKLATREKELAEYKTKLAEHDFKQSVEYKDQLWNPYVNTYKRGIAAVTGLKAQNADGTAREVSQQEAEFLLSLPDTKAMEVAQQMFGDNSAAAILVALHKSRIAEAIENLNTGTANFQKIADERKQKEFQDRQAMEDARGKLWAKENQAIAESAPWFKEDENDPEASEALKKGYEEIDRIFSEEFNQGKMEDIVKAHATMRHKAAAFNRMELTVKKLQAKVEELEKERGELMDSAPSTDTTTTPKQDSDSDKAPSQLLDSIKWGRR